MKKLYLRYIRRKISFYYNRMAVAMMKRCKQDETLILNTLIELRKVCIYKNVHTNGLYFGMGITKCTTSKRHNSYMCVSHQQFCYQLANAIRYDRLVGKRTKQSYIYTQIVKSEWCFPLRSLHVFYSYEYFQLTIWINIFKTARPVLESHV